MGVTILSSARLDYVHPDRLDDVWGYVKTGLITVLCKTRERWRIDDVRRDIEQHKAQLFMAVDGDICGFFIVEKLPDCLWVSVANLENAGAFVGELRNLAEASGSQRIAFASTRNGWARRLHGFKPAAVIYEMELI